MIDFPIATDESTDFRRAGKVVESCCGRLGLMQGMKATLAKHPGSTHWHYKRAKQSGTIEITVWPSERRVWITVQDGRRADWIVELIPTLKAELERALRPSRKRH
jgi:hypothetical protein